MSTIRSSLLELQAFRCLPWPRPACGRNRVGKCPRFVIPNPFPRARAARRIALKRNIEIYLDLSVCVPVRKVDAVDADIRYASGMSRLAALILACGQRKCNAGQRIIELIRHRLAAVHADHVLPVSSSVSTALSRPSSSSGSPSSPSFSDSSCGCSGFSGPPWGPLPKAPPQASLLRVPAPLLPRILLRRFFLFFGFLLFEGLLVLRFRFVRILIQRAVADARRACRRPGSPGSGLLSVQAVSQMQTKASLCILRQNRNRQHTQHHTAKQHQAEQSFFIVSFLSSRALPYPAKEHVKSVACGYHPHAREYPLASYSRPGWVRSLRKIRSAWRASETGCA